MIHVVMESIPRGSFVIFDIGKSLRTYIATSERVNRFLMLQKR